MCLVISNKLRVKGFVYLLLKFTGGKYCYIKVGTTKISQNFKMWSPWPEFVLNYILKPREIILSSKPVT